MSESDRQRRSLHYIGFVDMLFVVVLTLSVERSMSLFLAPLTIQFALLVTTLLFIALSWVFYHVSVDSVPYDVRSRGWIRFLLDALIALSYAWLAISISSVQQYGIVLCVIYILYGIHGIATVYESGWFVPRSLKPSSIPSFWLLFSVYFLTIAWLWSLSPTETRDWLFVLYPIGIVVSRYLRHKRRQLVAAFVSWLCLQPKPTVAIDVDGVIADQVPHVLARAEREKGLRMIKGEITEWDTRVGDEPFDKLIARYLRDPEFVRSMQEVQGAAAGLGWLRRHADVVLASSRPVETEADTVAWFGSKFGWKPDFVNTSYSGKSGIDARVLIDDNLENLRGFVLADDARLGVLFRQPWNVTAAAGSDLVTGGKIKVASNWEDIPGILEE